MMDSGRINIGLDVDGVVANFSSRIIKHAQENGYGDYFPKCDKSVDCWNMSDKFREVFDALCLEEQFWSEVEPLPNVPNFTPKLYCTARPISSEVTMRWLEKHGFPKAEVITVSHPNEKIKELEARDIHIFVDDYYITVDKINKESEMVTALLFNAPYLVGHREEIKGLPIINSLDKTRIILSAARYEVQKFTENN